MSYFAPKNAKLEVALFEWSSGGGINTASPLTLLAHTWTTAPVINVGGDGLTLPSGCYMASASVFATRTSATQNISFQFHVDGAPGGMAGYSDTYLNNSNVDQADIEFTLTATAELTLKIVGVEDSIPALTSDCRLIVWRTDT